MIFYKTAVCLSAAFSLPNVPGSLIQAGLNVKNLNGFNGL